MHDSTRRFVTGYCAFLILVFVLILTIDVINDGPTLQLTAFWALQFIEILGILALAKETLKKDDRLVTKMRSPSFYWLLFAALVTASIGSRYFVFAYSEPKDMSGFAQSALIATVQWCILFFIIHLGRLNSRNATPPAG